MLNSKMLPNGFGFLSGKEYFENSEDVSSIRNAEHLKSFKNIFNQSLAKDGVRNRSYLKLDWSRKTENFILSKNQNYFQSAESNKDNGGVIRRFSMIDASVINAPVMKAIFRKNLVYIKNYEPLSQYDDLTIGIHFIQYKASENGASYSSPVGLHMDDEPLVFVHLVELTENAIGGDNLIARLEDQEITNVIRLKNTLDTLCLTRDCYHAVTPLGSGSGYAHRDVILFTVEPPSTQKE